MPDELLYGRAGYLSGLLYVNANVSPPPIEPDIIKQVLLKERESPIYKKRDRERTCIILSLKRRLPV